MCQHQEQQQDQIGTSTATNDTMKLPLVKRVRFGESLHEERVISPLPKGIKRKDLFYTNKELRAQKESNRIAKRLSEEEQDQEGGGSSKKKLFGGFLNVKRNDNCCLRGLEHTLRTAERDRHIQEFVQAVLETHQEQKQYGIQDDYELFLVASAASKKDRIKAKRMGAQDARDAMCCWEKQQKYNRNLMDNDDTTTDTTMNSWSSFMSNSSSTTSCSLFDLSSSSILGGSNKKHHNTHQRLRRQQQKGTKKLRIFQFFHFQKSIKEEVVPTN